MRCSGRTISAGRPVNLSTDTNSAVPSPSISCLFPEILTIIFGYLEVRDKGRAAQVCVTWRNAAYNRRVWHGIEAKLHLAHPDQAPFESLVRRGIKRVQVLSMRRGARDALSAAVHNLESLSVRGCHGLTDATLSPVFESRLPALTSVDVSLCRQLTDSTLGRVVSSAPNLESLDVGGCSDITDNGVLLVACGLKHLRSLSLRGCRLVTDAGIAHLAGAGAIAVSAAGSSSTLERLVLHDCQHITDTGLGHIGAGLRGLRVLDVSFCQNVTDYGLQCIAKLPALQEVRARTCDGITDAGVAHFVHTPRLTFLDVAFCSHVTDRSLVHLARSMNVTHLHHLHFSACTITDEGLDHLTCTACDIRSLCIGQCVGVTDRGISMVADRLKSLEYIDVYGCSVSPVGLEKLQALPQLKTVNLKLTLWSLK